MSAPRILLNAIVKNETANLPRMLNSVLGHITAAVIVDTGSTDGTPELLKEFFTKHKIPHRVASTVFVNFEQARNFALQRARLSPFAYDYILLLDADMELVVKGPLPSLTAESYTLLQRQGGMAYYNVRLLRKNSKALYHGVTHEYVDVGDQAQLPDDVWEFTDHATGSTRGEKYERDTRLLEGYLVEHPNDARSLFYLAQTERDAGRFEKAIEHYTLRIAAGGWEEEVWYSRLQIARCYRALGNEASFVSFALSAYNARPSRAEPLYELAKYFREKKDQQQTGWLFAQAGAKIAYPKDLLFVEQYIHDWGFTEEKSILGAYNDLTRDEGFAACDKLSMLRAAPEYVRIGARTNLYYYLRPLVDFAPSFKANKVQWNTPDTGYSCTNPCITVHNNKLLLLQRTVNYRITPDGWYDMQGDDSIRTKNWLLELGTDLKPTHGMEVHLPVDWPPPMRTNVMGFEDMRIFSYMGQLWTLSCCLEQNTEYWRDQFLARLPENGVLTDCRRVDVLPKQHEKNWMPWVHEGHLHFVYKPGTIIDAQGKKLREEAQPLVIDHFSGSSQLVPFMAGWLGIVHEAWKSPASGKRFYQHRFVWFDDDAMPVKISPPFYFTVKDIEFAVGLTENPHDPGTFLISYGVNDREAWLGTISAEDIRSVLWHK